MKREERKVPKLRFTGFEGEWEKRKLIDFVDFYSGLTYSPDDVRESGVLVLRSSNVKQGEIVDADNVYVNPSKATSENVRIGDVIVVVRNGSRALIGKHAIIKNDKPNTVIGAFMTGIRSNYPSFVNALLDTRQFEKEIEKNMGATINQITGYMFAQMMFMIPSADEQEKIGQFLTNLDNLITFQQRKLDQIKEYKAGMLQKMFPQKGEKVPEVRFPGFEGEWNELKLGELSLSFEYGLNAAATEFDGKNKYIRITDIDDDSREFDQSNVTSPDANLSNVESYKLTEGDILFARTGASVGKTYIYKTSDGLVYYAGFLIRAKIKENYNPEFIFQNTLTKDYERFVNVTSMRSGQPGINAQEYSQFVIKVPSKPEQDKIAMYFRNLDNLITLYQRKLDQMKEYKKGLLQQMFV